MSRSSRSTRLLAGTLLATFACGAVAPGAALALSPTQRAAYVDAGTYAADLKAALDPAKQWIVRRAAATSAQTKACTAAGFPVGAPDPGPDPAADYSVPATEAPAPTVARARRAGATATVAKAAPRKAKLTAKQKKAKAQAKAKAEAKKLAAARAKAKKLAQQLAAAKAKANRPPVTVTTTTPAPTPSPPVTVPGPTVTVPGPTTTVTVTTPAPDVPTPTITREDCAGVEKLAIGFDIDETAFSNYGVGSGAPDYQDVSSLRNQALGTSVALQPVLELYKLARRYDVSAFFITARYDPILADPQNKALFESGALCALPYSGIGLCGVDLTTYDYRGLTLANLKSAGYTDVAGLYMRPANGTDKGGVKNAQRAELERRRGYRVIAMVGDNNSDVAGGFYDRAVKIPTLD